MVPEEVIRGRKRKSIMGQDHDVEASMSGGSHIFLESCTRDSDFDFSMLASRLEEEVACVTSSVSSEIWYIDNGASWHMTGIGNVSQIIRRRRRTFISPWGTRQSALQ